MLLPEITFQFRGPKDLSDPGGLIVTRVLTVSDLLSSINTPGFTVPSDKVLILSSAALVLVPGAGQIAQLARISVFDNDVLTDNPAELARGPDVQNATANLVVNLNWSGQAWLPPGGTIRGEANFNAGVAANLLELSLFGILIPRGSVHQG